ncbi:MAG: BlaI/MecI/CopY family transcriptional regulator [Clostridium sp.]|uniref:BlaI/MecI/CopY family transcriptional regulator n=1 Tax=Clostridium sp. TaxID=1506 RepID=UPI003D6CC1E4
MKELTKITEAEWLIMKTLWENEKLTSPEIIESLKNDSTWRPTTIQTFLSRLVKKGAVGVIKESKSYRYYPLVLEKQLRKEETESLIDKIYNGSKKLFIKNFINDVDLTEEDIQELKKMLDNKRG